MKVDILAFGAHPDDVELGCGGTIALSVAQGRKVAIVDLTQGELGTRGDVQTRKNEAKRASEILNIYNRENIELQDGFFENNLKNQLVLIEKIRNYQPNIVLCNSRKDRHIDHGRANQLVNDSCFLSGLNKIDTFDQDGKNQLSWRPHLILEYIQWNEVKPDIVINITGYLEKKIEAVKAYKSQLFDSKNNENNTPISTENFLNSVKYRAQNLGRLIGAEAGEGFTSKQLLAVKELDSLIK
ncbi:MAG: bacillithiol biosynthesis deacetylase BshB1 [Flavobacteriaceae bacterium TMED68]|nr:MAG: bacillithiol biosynthesis deacetylase BshB1 [Flavobacteriaceae bacterium TMED68]|tara:strand:- start:2250 stop:2972 length:723 start_codon:yes stop_codon:yes gene_type:complete